MTDHKACPSHCCPIHGCKYGYADCPVKAREVSPTYPPDNGCERCQDDREELARIMTDPISEDIARLLNDAVKDKIVAESPTIQALIEERDALRAEIAQLKGQTPGTYDVALVVYTRVEDAQDYGDAASIAEMALWQLIRNHGEQMPETGTLALYAKHGSGKRLGPVKVAKIAEINTGGYDTGIIRKPGTAAYRFWDMTPEQLEEMNRESMGG